jgi:perosamine synthetase
MIYDDVIKFIRAKYQTKDTVPLHAPVFIGNEIKYVKETIDSTFVSSIGSFVDRSEKMISEITNSPTAIAVVNATTGLQVALQLVGVKAGDEVITQALTFVATANAIHFCGAQPVFLDVDLDTMGLSADALNSFLSNFCECRDDGAYNKKTGKRIAACLPMHTFGFSVKIHEIKKICDDWKIALVEDAAESLGSTCGEAHLGTFGDVGVFSFNGNKIVTSGGGGVIVCNDIQLGKLAKHLTTTAKVQNFYQFEHDLHGYNFRLPNINAALLCAQLENLEFFINKKRSLADEYYEFFLKKGIVFRRENPGTKSNYWLMSIQLEDKKERDLFLELTNKSGVTTRPVWQLMFRLPMFKNSFKDSQKNAIFLEERIVNIPSGVIK